jgi:hypothetical protein
MQEYIIIKKGSSIDHCIKIPDTVRFKRLWRNFINKVGQPVTQLPPHIPRRAELPHRVPQSYSLMRLH